MRIINILLLLMVISCSSMNTRESGNKIYDSKGRLIRVNYYDRDRVKYTENLHYRGADKRPYRIVYKKRKAGTMVPMRETVYSFMEGKVGEKTFYRYLGNRKRKVGFISYKYIDGNRRETRYYKISIKTGKSFMFALQQYSPGADNDKKTRRFIRFAINPGSGKPMQTHQSVIYYKNNEIKSMKTWILDMKTKKMVEKNEKSIILINKIINALNYRNEREARGKGFTP